MRILALGLPLGLALLLAGCTSQGSMPMGSAQDDAINAACPPPR